MIVLHNHSMKTESGQRSVRTRPCVNQDEDVRIGGDGGGGGVRGLLLILSTDKHDENKYRPTIMGHHPGVFYSSASTSQYERRVTKRPKLLLYLSILKHTTKEG